MNSCLYRARVMHHRMLPKEHRFYYDLFMFYLDLDEIDSIARKMRFMSRNRFNLFNFRDKDHLQLPKEDPEPHQTTKQHILKYLSENGIEPGNGRIMLLTHLCTLGYQFNPVSFYFCYAESGEPVAAIVEVCNTYREMKPYLLGENEQHLGRFRLRTAKNFYVSPFTDLDTRFDFDLEIPGERLSVRIDDYTKEDNRFFISTLTGDRKPLTDTQLLIYFISFPLITLQVIGLIHWQAMKLWLKKLSWHKKEANMELQQEVYRRYKKQDQVKSMPGEIS